MGDKKYYWLKLKEDFFEEDTLAWLEEQTNGKEYCLFYLKLCLKSLKTNGILIRNVGQILIPYDVKKLGEITKTDIDTVTVAMELFKKIGLIQILDNGEIYITQLEQMVGSETKWAKYKKKERELKKLDNVQLLSNVNPKNVHTEIEKEKEIEKKNKADKPARARFTKPTIEEVQAYCRERGNSVDANRFIDYYEANGWKVGKNPMSDWRAAIRTWEKNAYSTPQKAQSSVTGTLDFEAMEAYLHGGGN